jgi:N-acetylglucosamine kinase-like BadF-type ATPase
MSYFLGIDAGGSKTDCAVGDDAVVLGRALGSSSKIQRVGEHDARAALHSTILQACHLAEIQPRKIRRVCIGIAGLSHPDIAGKIREMIAEIVPGEIEVVGDNLIALEAACHGMPGMVVVAGTGSIAFGRNAARHEARAGGWGPAVSDEGSGTAIGRAAVAGVLRTLDNDRTTALFDAIRIAWRATGVDDIVRIANATPLPDFAALFPVVVEAAAQHDPLACNLLARAGADLAQLAMIVLRRLWPANAPVRVGITGGVFGHSQLVRRAFYHSLRAARPNVAVSFAIAEPVVGALHLARMADLHPGGAQRSSQMARVRE